MGIHGLHDGGKSDLGGRGAAAALGRYAGAAESRLGPTLLPVDGFPAARLMLATRMTTRLKGLLLSPETDALLLLAPCHDVHTFGMGYAIDVAFIDDAGTVIEACRDVLPNSRLRNPRASAVLERFALPREVWLEEGERLALGRFERNG